MNKICILAVGALLSAAQAQLIVSEKIYQQMQARENPPMLMKSSSDASGDANIYTIAGTRSFTSGKNFQVKKIDGFHRFTLNNKNGKKRQLLSEDEVRSRAMKDVKSLLPKEIADSCAITSVGYDYTKTEYSDAKVVGSTVMMHRKLDGISVRGGSYILVNYDSTGNMTNLDIRWEKYNKIPATSTVENSEKKKIHRQEFDEMLESITQNFKEKKIRGSLDNSVQTWASFEDDKGNVFLIPSVTFIGQYSSQDADESIPMTFDIPTDASLVPHKKAIVRR